MRGHFFAGLLIVEVIFGCARAGAQNDNLPLDGAALYKEYCASCHGTAARGDGPMARSLKVPPADLTRISARNGGTFPSQRITRIISGEEQPRTGHGTREMPVWGPFFSRVDSDLDLGPMRIDALVRYLQRLQVK